MEKRVRRRIRAKLAEAAASSRQADAAAVLRRWYRFLAEKGWQYWAGAAIALAISVHFAPDVDKHLHLIYWRYALFQRIGEVSYRPPRPRFVKVVMIHEREYRQAQNHESGPIDPGHLAELVSALDKANVAVIALDFQTHFEDEHAAGTLDEIPQSIKKGAERLAGTIADVSSRRTVVIPKELFSHTRERKFRADYLVPYGICTKPGADAVWQSPGAKGRVSCGYTQLTTQSWRMPAEIHLTGGGMADSFSLAIAKAWNGKEADIGSSERYTDYIPQDYMSGPDVEVSAEDVIRGDPETLAKLRFKPVIVSGDWIGPDGLQVDLHETPIGTISGAMVHANFAEALLDGRTYYAIPKSVLDLLEISFGILAAIVFAAYPKLWVKVSLFFGFAFALLLAQWLMFMLAGEFFDGLVPLIGVSAHSIIERLLR